jgi:hypothetical protein
MNPPQIEITSPEDGSFVDAGEVTVSGTVEDTSQNLTVDVNGNKALLSDGSWSAKVPLVSGPNVIAVCAVDRANNTANEAIVLNRKASFLRDFNESSRFKNENKTRSTNETYQIPQYKDLSLNKIYLFIKELISNCWRRF